MRQSTYEKAREVYWELKRRHESMLKFNDQEDFVAEIEGLGVEVTGPPSSWRITRGDEGRGFEPNNVRLVYVESEEELSYLIYPSY